MTQTAHQTFIRPALADDEAVWRGLWRGYCEFYEAYVPEDVTAHTWGRIIDPSSSVNCVFAEHDGEVVGFANYIVHENTWELHPLCYLEDLFVDPAARGSGAGRALIQWLKDQMPEQGWARLYWVTRRDNATARRLYDRFTQADDFVRYVIRQQD